MQKIKFSKKAVSLFLTVALLLGMMVAFSPSGSAEPVESAESTAMFPWYDTSLTFAERATALVAEMTESEKASQITTASAPIPRLDVRAYDWWREAITGPQNMPAVGIPTSFSIGQSWNTQLRHDTASVIGIETRAYFQDRFRWLGQYCPTIEPLRDPRWGRNEEGYSEDPYLSGEMAVSFIRGIQGGNDELVKPSEDPRYYTANEHGERYLKVMATAKHFAANNSEGNRNSGSSNMSDKILREYYTPSFEAAAKRADSAAFMTAYNRVNWVPAFANTYLNNTLLRKTWGFEGFTVTDCGGLANLSNSSRHNWKPGEDRVYGITNPEIKEAYGNNTVTTRQAAAFSLMGGTDMSCTYANNGTNDNTFFWSEWESNGEWESNIPAAINDGVLTDNGVITWDDVDRSLVRMFTQRIATGEFDVSPDEANINSPNKWDTGGLYGSYRVGTDKDTESPEHIAVGLEAARQGIVLLKNEDNILPIKTTGPDAVKSIAVVGRLHDHNEQGAFNYSPQPNTANRTTLRSGMTKTLAKLGYTGTINYYFPASNVNAGSNIFNFEKFIINGVPVNAGAAESVTNCVKTGNIIDSIADRSYAIYKVPEGAFSTGGLIINQLDISVSTNGLEPANTLPVVEVRRGTPTGELLGTITGKRTADLATYSIGVGDFQEVTLHGTKDDIELCFVFTTSRSVTNGFSSTSLEEIKNADAVIYYIGGVVNAGSTGLSGSAGEGRDRSNLDIPGNQLSEIKQVLSTGAKVIMPIQAIGMLEIGEIEDNVPAILYTCWNGQSHGDALAEVLLGQVNPSGHLSSTWYANQKQLPNIYDYAIRPGESTEYSNPSEAGNGLGRTYQYFTGDILYPFGYGLSYTNFEYSNASLSKSTVSTSEKFTVSVDVKNTGTMSGADVVQIYLVAPDAGNGKVPFRQLKGFSRVELDPGQTKTVTIDLNSSDFWFIEEKPWSLTTNPDQSGKRLVTPGNYKIEVASFADRDNNAKATEKSVLGLTIDTVVAPALQTVTLMGDKIKVTPAQNAATDLYVALSDDTVVNGSEMGDDYTVVYSSRNEGLVTVDQNGVITMSPNAAKGTATIDVTVTYNGKTLTDSYSVAVDPGSDDSNANLRSFSYDGMTINAIDGEYEYDVNVPNNTDTVVFNANNILAQYPDNVNITVKLNPADGKVEPGKPCVASVRVRSKTNYGDGGEQNYTISFGHMELTWAKDLNDANGFNSYLDVRFSDGKTNVNAIMGWYDKASGTLKKVFTESRAIIARNESDRLHIVGDKLSDDALEGLTIKKLIWTQSGAPLAPAVNYNWITPKVSDIQVNGESISDFHPDKTEYTYEVPFGNTTPKVAASYDSTKMSVNITQASSVPGSAIIVVTSAFGSADRTYKVNFTAGNPSRVIALKATPTNHLDPNDPVWNTANEILLNKRSTTNQSASMEALGKAKLLWDDSYLYARVEVTKNYPLNSSSSQNHMKDSVELFFSERNFRGSYGSTVANGNQYRVNYLGAISQKNANSGWTGSGTVLEGLPEGQYGYVLTYRIPWVDSNVAKVPGTVMGLDVQINAMQTSSIRTCFSWSDGADGGYNSSLKWGELVLG